ncbi:MAG: gamma-glutamylcyclotransferase [Pseudomonadota bacterium]
MAQKTSDQALWVFAYGSLLWNPGIPVATQQRATLHGYRRAFCMDSVHYRGTEEAPGLVLALDHAPGRSCEGVAYQVAPEHRDQALDYLRERELVTSAYLETWLDVALTDGSARHAVTYVIDPSHAQYRGHMSLQDQAQVIARARGRAGCNRSYLENTLASLADLEIPDPELSELGQLVAEVTARLDV